MLLVVLFGFTFDRLYVNVTSRATGKGPEGSNPGPDVLANLGHWMVDILKLPPLFRTERQPPVVPASETAASEEAHELSEFGMAGGSASQGTFQKLLSYMVGRHD